jgi:hypothetical protein
MGKFNIVGVNVCNDSTATVTVEASVSQSKVANVLDTHDYYLGQLGLTGWDVKGDQMMFYYDGSLEGHTMTKTFSEAKVMVRELFKLV